MELFIYNENRMAGLHFIYIELNQDDEMQGRPMIFSAYKFEYTRTCVSAMST